MVIPNIQPVGDIIYNEAKVIQMHLNGQGVQEFEAFPTLIHVP